MPTMKRQSSGVCSKRLNEVRPSNILNVVGSRSVEGSLDFNKFYSTAEKVYCQNFLGMNVCHYYNTCEKRVTEVATHPNKSLVLTGTKGGSMTLSNISNKVVELYNWDAKGPGNSILDIKFPYHVDNKVLTASLDGTVKLWDLERLREYPLSTLLDTKDYLKWFCSVEPAPSNGIVLAGCNKGGLTIMDKDYKVVSTLKVHKNKINSIDFNKSCSNLFATASLDKSVKIFDIRNLNAEGVEKLIHKKPINTAVFSKMNGQRLLTSDQNSEINLFFGPLWNHERTIVHPHRHFQHLTPIRASWHPLLDLIVIGRYPDEKIKGFSHVNIKSVDIFSAETGQLKAELLSSNLKPIITSIAEFSHTGEVLVTGTGSLVVYWHLCNHSLRFKESKTEKEFEEHEDSDYSSAGGLTSRKRQKKKP